ncbi:MAG: hypothetical protein KDH15_08645 [Rhodocyclaceae bacterium]|nr:hypothetical protein [Rhodocyclaceae bacterium]
MRERPKGDALLACARRLLRDEVLPALPGDRKHALLMALNAMSIAERQLHNGDEPERVELAELRALLDDEGAALGDANRRLGRLIRAGDGDPGSARRGALLAQLRAQGVRRLAESNPKVLPKTPQ